MGWIDQRGSHVLPRNECLRLLAVHAGGLGRIGLVDSGHAIIEPMIYRMLDHDVVVQIGSGSVLDAAEDHSIVSFEVDNVAPPDAWSVLVRGPARRVAEEAVTGHARPAGVGSLVPEPGTSFVVIRTDVVSGRRFLLRLASQSAPGAGRELGQVPLRAPLRVGPEATIREAAAAMEDAQVSSVLLGEHPASLVSEDDLIGALAAGLGADDPANEAATRTAPWATTTTTVAGAAAMMAHYGVEHLVVFRVDGTPVGVLSSREALRLLLDDTGTSQRELPASPNNNGGRSHP